MPFSFHLTDCCKCSTPEQLLFVVDIYFFPPVVFFFASAMCFAEALDSH